ncbi:Crp/Fnr family transcriptional regulator [Phaeodactylibacter luteus]|uniref:Crp/Fnr family transcriptional regulator n=1 Tax=Phaeodactylibacter luteus TaxID=1564516 RepID=A0A5C6S9M9_9BACT|nr:Crp/Fnr family transcriptional regulator [Phaeodactylibacter luteus]TXB70284.1 Crp/Fnr family transcriptional regulator [Phaeodactylibacter luteus]
MGLIQELYKVIEKEGGWSPPRLIPRGSFLVQEGAPHPHLYYLLSGSVRVFLQQGEEEHTIRFGYEGDFIAALDSFISGKPTIYSLQALRQCEVLSIPRQAYEELLGREPGYRRLYQQLLEQLALQQMEREQDLLINAPAARYHRVLSRSPQLFQEVPHKYIASYLRMTPETLSRLKK